MGLLIGKGLLDVAAHLLFVAGLGLAIALWGRGIRHSRRGDLVLGPVLLAALCGTVYVRAPSHACGMVGTMVIVFGLATVLLSVMAGPDTLLKRQDVLALGAGGVVVGVFLGLLL